MIISVDKDYYITADFSILGYVGEVNSRKITFEDYQCCGADFYKMRFKYPDGVTYDVDISNGTYTIDGSILRCVGDVSIQIFACRHNDTNYEYVKKSNIITKHICRSLDGETASIPTYEQSVEALEKVMSAARELKIATDEEVDEMLDDVFTSNENKSHI